MKRTRFLLGIMIFALTMPVSVFADSTPKPAPSPGAERLSWAMAQSGAMPKMLIIGIILLCAAIVAAIVTGIILKGR